MQGGHVEEIKSRLPIDVVVGSYLTLEHKGKYLCARCPFHNEKSASFYVSPDRGTYYCFGCGEKGDIFSFVEKYEGLDFRGALSELARRAGVELTPVSKETLDKKEALYSVLEKATKYFEKNLLDDSRALSYVKNRGVSDEFIKNFRIGFALPSWGNLYDHLKSSGFSDDVIISAGLGLPGEKGIYDRFRSRIMFPIEDSSGRVVGFSGRILPEFDDGKSAKYVNSPETPVYHKSDILFGFSKAKQYIRKYDFSILVEGQFDVVLSHQYGFPNTVAVSGTAFSGDIVNDSGNPTNLGILSRLSKNMMLALDSDDAGEKAKIRVIKEAVPLGIVVKMVKNIPGSKDPADILSQEGGEAVWKDVLKESLSPVEALCIRIINKHSVREKQIKEVKEIIFGVIGLYQNSVDRHEASRIVEKYFSIPIDYIVKDVESILKTSSSDIVKEEVVQNKTQFNIKDKFYGILYASELVEGPLREYRDSLKDWLMKTIPEDVQKLDLEETSKHKEELSLEAEVEFVNSNQNKRFVEDIQLQYEESVIRAILAKVKSELVMDESNKDLITKYADLQKKIELIKQKRR